MVNNIINITADGNFQEVVGIPHQCRCIAIQARTAADVTLHWRRQTTTWVVKSGTVKTLVGQFNDGDLFVQATNAVVIELECATGMSDIIFQA